MSDLFVNLACSPDQPNDFRIEFGDLMTGNELSTAVVMSLFTDGRAQPDDLIPDGTDPRGWWADALDGERYGSRLWLLERANATAEVLSRAKGYAVEALQWLIDDGIAKSIDVAATAVGGCKNVLMLTVTICRPDLKNIRWQWRYAWDLRLVTSCEKEAEYC